MTKSQLIGFGLTIIINIAVVAASWGNLKSQVQNFPNLINNSQNEIKLYIEKEFNERYKELEKKISDCESKISRLKSKINSNNE